MSDIKLFPTTGSGSAVLIAEASANTGRTERVQKFNVTATNANYKLEKTIRQRAADEFVDLAYTKYDVATTDTSVSITGVSNSKNLLFAITENGGELALPTDYLIYPAGSTDGVSVPNGTDIPGDPGAKAEYSFVITIPTTSVTTGKTVVTIKGGDLLQEKPIEINTTAKPVEESISVDTPLCESWGEFIDDKIVYTFANIVTTNAEWDIKDKENTVNIFAPTFTLSAPIQFEVTGVSPSGSGMNYEVAFRVESYSDMSLATGKITLITKGGATCDFEIKCNPV